MTGGLDLKLELVPANCSYSARICDRFVAELLMSDFSST